VGELLRRALSDILARGEVYDPALEGAAVAVTEVRAAPDLKRATVYVSPLGGRGAEAAVAALTRLRPEIRHRLARAVELRHVPELRFVLDDTPDRLDAARRLFASETVRRDIAGA
jgi:ribosome-binding factor A